MAITARELVFYIRAENQASRVFKRVAQDIRGLPSNKDLQQRAAHAQRTGAALSAATGTGLVKNVQMEAAARGKSLASQRAALQTQLRSNQLIKGYNDVQARILANQRMLNEAKARQSMIDRRVNSGRPLKGFNMVETVQLQNAARQKVIGLEREFRALGMAEDEARLKARLWANETALAARQASAARIQGIANAFHSVGRAAQLAGAIGVATLIALAHRSAIFQTQTSLAATQARPINAPASAVVGISNKLNTEILKQMHEFPAASQEMADSFYQIFSGTKVQSIAKASDMLRTFNKMAVAGGTDLKTMTDAGITLFNNFPTEFKNMDQAANVFFASVRYGRMTASQLANALAYIVPIAGDVGSTFRNVAQDMAFFTRQTGGRLTRQDAQGYARLIQLLGRTDTAAGLAKKGIDVFDKSTGKMRPLVKIMADIHDKLKLNPQETLNFFKTITALGSGKSGTQGTIQALRIFAQAQQHLKSYQDVVNNVAQDQDEFNKSFDAMSKTPGVRWAVMTNNLKAFATVIGEQALPALIEMGKPLFRLFHWFDSLSDHSKSLIAELLVFGSVGALVGGTFLVIASSIYRTIAMFKLVRGVQGLAGLSSEAGAVSARLALGLGIPGLIITLILFRRQLEPVTNLVGGLGNVLQALFAIMTVMTFQRLIAGMAGTAVAATAATTEVTLLQRRLMLLNGFVAVATVLVIYRKQIKGFVNQAGNWITENVPGMDKNPDDWTRHIPGVAQLQDSGAVQKAMDVLTFGTSRDIRRANAPINRPDLRPQDRLTHPGSAARAAMRNAPGAARLNAIAAKARATGGTSSTGMGFTDADTMAAVRNIVRLDNIAKKHPTLDNFKKANAAMAALTQVASQQQLSAAQQMISSLESVETKSNKKRLTAQKKAARDRLAAQKKELAEAKQTIESAARNLSSAYQSLYQANKGALGTLFSGPYSQSPRVQNRLAWGGKMGGMDLLRDLQSQVRQFKEWRGMLDRLSEMGAPFSLIQQIQEAGPGSIDSVRALLTLSKRNLRRYFKTFQQGQNAIQVATNVDFKRQLKHYRSFGQNIALAIIQGLRDERTPMLSYFETMIRDMFPGLDDKATKGKKPAKGKGTTGRDKDKAPTRTTQGAGGNTIINVNNIDPKADVRTQVKHALFIHRNRHHL